MRGRSLFLALLLALLAGCSTTRYVPVEVVNWRDSVRTIYQRDTIHQRDSVVVTCWQRGDTIYQDRYKVQTIYRERARLDTIIVHRRDSVPYPVEVAKEVVKYQLRWWQKPLVWLGGLSLLVLAVWWIVRARKR